MLIYAETVVDGRYSKKRLAKISEWWQRRHSPRRRLKRLPKVREVLQYRQSSSQVYSGTKPWAITTAYMSAQSYRGGQRGQSPHARLPKVCEVL